MRSAGEREAGGLLLEFVFALGVFTVGVLSVCAVFQTTSFASVTTSNLDDARTALVNVSELLKRSEFSTLNATYDGTTIEAQNLKGPDGQPAQVVIQCFVDELTIPPEFGPVVDIDGRGGLDNPDCSTSYRILPVLLCLTYENSYGDPDMCGVYLVLEDGS